MYYTLHTIIQKVKSKYNRVWLSFSILGLQTKPKNKRHETESEKVPFCRCVPGNW